MKNKSFIFQRSLQNNHENISFRKKKFTEDLNNSIVLDSKRTVFYQLIKSSDYKKQKDETNFLLN